MTQLRDLHSTSLPPRTYRVRTLFTLRSRKGAAPSSGAGRTATCGDPHALTCRLLHTAWSMARCYTTSPSIGPHR